MSPILADTQIWLWQILGDERLTPVHRDALDEARERSELFLSSISVLEVSRLITAGRLEIYSSAREWIARSLEEFGAQTIGLDAEIAMEAYLLPGEFHKDPADRVIVATARVHGLRLLSADRLIQQYAQAGHIEFVE